MEDKPHWANEIAKKFRLTVCGVPGCLMKDEEERFITALCKAKADGVRIMGERFTSEGWVILSPQEALVRCQTMADKIERGEA